MAVVALQAFTTAQLQKTMPQIKVGVSKTLDIFICSIFDKRGKILDVAACRVSPSKLGRPLVGLRRSFASKVNITNSTIYSNTSNSAGGINSYGGTVNITNTTISQNYGGGLKNYYGRANVVNSTITGNSSGRIYLWSNTNRRRSYGIDWHNAVRSALT